MDLGKCFNDSLDVYKRNVLLLLLAAVLNDALSVLTLLILAGPLYGGICVMTLNAFRRDDLSIDLGDLFRAFDRFGPLVGLFFVTFFGVAIGFVLLVVPGVFLSTVWMFPFLILVDRGMPVFDALRESYQLVMRNGFWNNLLLFAIELALTLGPIVILPAVGEFVALVTSPLAWLLVTRAYMQQIGEVSHSTVPLPPTAP
jgi:uncharacterized membrane protein